uniref:Receptor ligand binding region domain-containing protein n=1 Tax=Xenopus tropicalis TaxID=8364 RepID=A0A1B8YAG9_XENTR
MAHLFPIRLKVLLLVLMFQVLPAAAEKPSANSTCQLSCSSETKYYRDSDLMVGGIFHINSASISLFPYSFKKKERERSTCDMSSFRLYRYLLVLIYTIGEINKDPEILPNVTLGYHIVDSCNRAVKSLEGTFSILSGTQQLIPNYSCWNNRKVVGFIGDLSSVSSLSMATLTGIYRYPQISYGSRDPVFNDRVQFPSFYRTIPDELSELKVIVKLIKHFGWKWVGLIVSDDETGLRAGENLEREMKIRGICLAFFIIINNGLLASTDSIEIKEILVRSTANVIVILASLMNVLRVAYPQNRKTFNGVLVVSYQRGEIPGFKEFIYGLDPTEYKEGILFPNVSERLSDCEFPNPIPGRTGISLPICTESEFFDEYDLPINDTTNFRISYGVYTAVYTMALALHKLYMDQKLASHPESRGDLQAHFKQWQVRL